MLSRSLRQGLRRRDSSLTELICRHSSLLSDPDTRIFIKVNSNGKLLPVFERSRAGDKKVMCFVPASEGVEFRTKKPKSSVSVAVYFGETL
mgnify:FL=1|jgi:hypothetical protein